MSDEKPELVIIRRRSAFDEAPFKGGVWKIAYADFMTAMMAFFLVMWLLNALNQNQREEVASYFNPIRLSESAPAPKGLKDPAKKDPAKQDPAEAEGQEGKRQPAGPNEERRGDSPTAEKPPYYAEKVLFRDPYAALSEIMAGSSQESGQRRAGALTSSEEDGLKGGEAYRDPFDPGYWKLAPQAQEAARAAESAPNPKLAARENAAGAHQADLQPTRRAKPDEAGGPAPAGAAAPSANQSALPPPVPAPPASGREGSAQANLQTNSPAETRSPEAARETESRAAAQAQPTVKQLQTAIRDALSDIKPGSGPVAEVRQVEEGLLVSLTDDANFGMFAVGSAEPRAELIRVIDKIGPLLTKRPGVIIVRGHTDNRPYRSEAYDNWRLSTARAQMAYYMLVRSGVDVQRIEHVEGYADRRPKLQNDPAAAQNRRIEIMVREKRP